VITPDEALLIFNKWRDERALILCGSALHSCWAFVIQGRITVTSGMAVRLDSLDGRSCFSLDLNKAEAIEYGDLEHIPESIRPLIPPESRNVSTLTVAIPLRVARPGMRRDKLIFLELPPD
jgi:hypothetical protein